MLNDLRFCLIRGKAGDEVRVYRNAFSAKSFLFYREVFAGLFRGHHSLDGKIKPARECEVSFVMGRNGHDGAGAVTHEHVIGNPDGQCFAAYRINGVGAGKDPGFLRFFALDLTVSLGFQRRIFYVFLDCFALRFGRNRLYQWMFRGQNHVRGAEQGIRPGGKYLDVCRIGQ